MNITNTTKLAKEKPEQILAASILLGSSGAIEFQESRGQQELVHSDVLPTDGIEEVRKIIESSGGAIGDRVIGDKIFTNVTLPEGWTKKETSHSMWSMLLDDKGRERASIFYKASFYDRSAHIRSERRFAVDTYSHDIEGEVKAVVKDACGEVEFSTDIVKVGKDEMSYRVWERLTLEVEKYLNEHFPDWRNPEAYWD